MAQEWRAWGVGLLGGLALIAGSRGAQAAPEETLRFEATARGVRAVAGEEVRWEFPIVSHTTKPDEAPMPAPIRVGEALVFCGEGQLYEANPADGVIRRRVRLPGRCAGVEARGEGYEVRCQGNSSSPAPWTQSYPMKLGEGEPGPVLPEIFLLFTPRRQAEELVVKDPQASLAALDRRRAMDPTNPWVDLKRAEVLQRMGRADESRQAVADALGHDHRYDLEVLMMTARLDLLDPGRADEAFGRGMKYLLERGYEPELATSVLIPTVLLGRPNDSSGSAAQAPLLDLAKDHAILERHAARVLDLAPNAEGSTWFFAALTAAAEQRGDQAAAARWRPLGQRTEGTALFAPGPPEVQHLGALTQAVVALVAALVGLALIKTIQSVRWAHKGAVPIWVRRNPFARWGRIELLGFLLALAVLIGLGRRSAYGVSIVGAMAAAPTSLLAGNLAHPEARGFLEKSLAGDPAAGPRESLTAIPFALALSRQIGGDVAGAEKLYRESLPSSAAARSNLAAMAAARGDREGAQRLWQEAHAIDPQQDAARAGLGLPDAGPRAERLRRFGVERPLLAIPRSLLWAEFWREQVRGSDLMVNPMHLIQMVSTVGSEGAADEARTAVLLVVFLAIPAIFALLTWRPRVESRPAWRKVSVALDLLAPGASWIYGPLGFLLAGVALFALSGFTISLATQGQAATSIDALAMPIWGRYYGLQELTLAPSPLVSIVRFWWVLFVLNALLVVAAEWRGLRASAGSKAGGRAPD